MLSRKWIWHFCFPSCCTFWLSRGHATYTLSFKSSPLPIERPITDASEDGRLSLHYAVERGHTECVRVLLEYPPPIHLACSHGQLDSVKQMVEKCGLDVLTARDQEGGTTLHSSTTSICSEVLISYLVENGVDANEVDQNGFTPLSNAIQLGSVPAVEELMRKGGDPLIKDKWGHTAIHRAVLSERIEIFRKVASSEVVQELAASVDGRGYCPIHYALKLGLSEIVSTLLQVTPKVVFDSDGNNYMHLAALSGDQESFSHLLSVHSFHYMINEANISGATPLHCAAMCCNASIVKKLLDHGAVIHKDNNGHTPFMCACATGNLAAVRLLYSGSQFQRDWVDNAGCTALHLAVDGNNPDVITFCLDTGMAVTLNDHQLSFFDSILNLNNRKLASAVVSHKRWGECMDICCPDKPHPIMRILDQMPNIYQLILDQCYTKCTLDPAHPNFWEKFNFRCLSLDPVKIEKQDSEEEGIEMDELKDYDPVRTQLHTESEVAVEVTAIQRFRRQASRRRRRIARRVVKGREEDSLTVVRKLIKNRLESYLLHPVVEQYIKIKWNGFGVYFQLAIMVIHFLLAAFFSVFILLIPLPLQSLDSTTFQNQTGAEFDSIRPGARVLLFISLIFAVLNFVVFLLDVYVHGLNLILDFLEEVQIWSNLLASVNIFIYVISVLVNGVQRSLWDAAALGVFFAWFSFGFTLQFVNILNIGIYITMLMSSTKLIFKVLIILLVFLLAFSFSFYILVGTVDVLQYSTVPLSLFNQLHTLVGVVDYLGFVTIEQSDGEGFRYSVLTFLFLSMQIVVLPIVIINLLIGLAVGDIALIRKEAIITRQAVEVRALASLDRKILPTCLVKGLSKQYHKHYPNRKTCSTWTINFFHKTFDSQNIVRKDLLKSNLEVAMRQEQAEEKERHEKRLDKLQELLEQLTADRLVHLEKMKQMREMITKLFEAQEAEAKKVQ